MTAANQLLSCLPPYIFIYLTFVTYAKVYWAFQIAGKQHSRMQKLFIEDSVEL